MSEKALFKVKCDVQRSEIAVYYVLALEIEEAVSKSRVRAAEDHKGAKVVVKSVKLVCAKVLM